MAVVQDSAEAQRLYALLKPYFTALGSVLDLTSGPITGILYPNHGGTGADLGATGGPNQIVKQTTTGGALIVGLLVAADIPVLDTAKITTGTLAAARGGTGVSNAGTLTNASNTTITGGGTLALAGFTATIPATGTVALLGTAQTFSAAKTFSVNIEADAGINVGTASGAGTGEISTSGNMGIRQAVNSTAALQVKGQSATNSDYSLVLVNSTPATQFYVANAGFGFLNNTAWSYSSDASKKKNIRPLGRDILHLNALKPIRFDYIDGPADRMGFVAQDVQAVFPELVNVEPDGTLSMQTTDLIPVMLHGFKRLVKLLITKGVITVADIAGVENEP